MTTPHPATVSIDHLLRQCDIRRTRRSGPGGQHRNKVETAIVIEHTPTGIRGEASERRSQAENRDVAIQRLRVNLALEVRTPLPDDSPVSVLWQSRAKHRRLSVNPSHTDFPALLAEALDALVAHEMDTQAGSLALSISHSQLVKFLRCEPRAMEAVNRHRERLDRSPLK